MGIYRIYPPPLFCVPWIAVLLHVVCGNIRHLEIVVFKIFPAMQCFDKYAAFRNLTNKNYGIELPKIYLFFREWAIYYLLNLLSAAVIYCEVGCCFFSAYNQQR